MSIPVLFLHSSGPQGPGEGSDPFCVRLRDELGGDYEVLFPLMPDTATDPHYEPWRDRLVAELAALEGRVIVFGHSLGGSVALKHCAEAGYGDQVAGLVIVAAPFWGSEVWEREWAMPEGWSGEGRSLPPTFLFHSRDDDVSPFSSLERFAKLLPEAEVQPLDGYGHLYDRGDLSPIVDAVRSL
jgi:predicted alpha/beta hydrolase family esterase